MSKHVRIPPNCDAPFFAGESKVIRITVPELATLDGFGLEFFTTGRGWTFRKDRTSGIENDINTMIIRFQPADTEGQAGEWPFRARVISPVGEIVTVAYGTWALT